MCLVDDDASVLKSMHYLLASEGFKVRPFNKAEDFLAHATSHHVPVVVTDIWHGWRNGFGSAGPALRNLARRTKVIVMHRARRFGRAPAADQAIRPVPFFMKPFDDDKFIGAVRDALNRS